MTRRTCPPSTTSGRFSIEPLEDRWVLASATYSQLVGEPPVATSSDWQNWYQSLLTARLDQAELSRAQNFYFSQMGNDQTGNGTAANPFRSLAKAQSILDASSGDVALLFRRGDQWLSSTGLDVVKPKVTIGAYGDQNLAKPLFSAFTNQVESNAGWVQESANSWTLAEPAKVGWLRESTSDAARLSPFAAVSSVAEVAGTARSWFWDGALLHFNAGAGVNPNSTTYEIVGDEPDDGVNISGDGSLIVDIRCDGWGCTAGTAYQNYGISATPEGRDAVVVWRCESYYQGRHGISMFAHVGNSSGGVATFVECTTGYMNSTASGVNAFNAFQANGDNEAIFDHCTVRFGELPKESLLGGYSNIASFYGHTGTVGTTTRLFIVNGGNTLAEELPGSTYASGAAFFDDRNLPGDDADLSSYRAFVVDTQTIHNKDGMIGFSPKTAFINDVWILTTNTLTLSSSIASGGVVLNATIQLTSTVADAPQFILSTNYNLNTTRILNSHIQVSGPVVSPEYGTAWRLFGPNVKVANSILVNLGAKPFELSTNNSPANLSSNATYHVVQAGTNGVDQDPEQIILSSPPILGAAPTSTLLGQGANNPFGLGLEYDRYWNPRIYVSNSIGPVELESTSGTPYPPPVPDAGGPYVVSEGGTLTLDASASPATTTPTGPLTFTWDVNGDNIFGDATGLQVTLSWAQLVALGVSEGPNSYAVRVRAVSPEGLFRYSSSVSLTLLNIPPIASIGSNSVMVRGFSAPFVLTANDPSPTAQAAGFTFLIDWNNDGTVDQTIIGPSGTTVNHTFGSIGSAVVRVVAQDRTGSYSNPVLKTLSVQEWGLMPNVRGTMDLVYGGSSGIDAVAFLGGGGNNVLLWRLFVNNQMTYALTSVAGVTGNVIALGGGSGDLLIAELLQGKTAQFFGDDGDDILIGSAGDDSLTGGAGADMLIGLSGNDTLIGNDGNDLLLGGLGADLLSGQAGNDLLIAGPTTFQTSPDALYAIQAEWLSGRSLAQKAANLTGSGAGVRFNQNYFIIPNQTATSDDAIDVVLGGADADLIIYDFQQDSRFVDLDPADFLLDLHPHA